MLQWCHRAGGGSCRRVGPRIGPYLVALGLLAIMAQAAPARAQPRIMIIGDSIMAGTHLHDPGRAVAVVLQRAADVIVHNFSSPGAMMTDKFPFAGMRQAGSAVYLVAGPFGLRGLVVAIGTNDWSDDVGLTAFRDAYAGFLPSLPPDVRFACLGPTWRADETDPNANGDTLDQFRDVVRDVCTAAGGEYLDGRVAIPNNVLFFPDGLHPNQRGHRALAKFLKAEMERLGWLP